MADSLIIDVFGTQISTGITGIVKEIIGYAIFIVMIMLIYYCIKFFLVHGPPGKTKAEKDADAVDDAERVDGFQKMVGAKLAESKQKRTENSEREHRGLLALSAKRSLVNAEQATEELLQRGFRAQTKKTLDDAKAKVKEIDNGLEQVQKELKKARLKASGATQKYLKDIGSKTEVLRQYIDTNVLAHFPANETDPQWVAKVNAVRTGLNNGACLPYFGALIFSLDEFIDKNAMNVP